MQVPDYPWLPPRHPCKALEQVSKASNHSCVGSPCCRLHLHVLAEQVEKSASCHFRAANKITLSANFWAWHCACSNNRLLHVSYMDINIVCIGGNKRRSTLQHEVTTHACWSASSKCITSSNDTAQE